MLTFAWSDRSDHHYPRGSHEQCKVSVDSVRFRRSQSTLDFEIVYNRAE
jgi:hypothetical protein